MTTRKGWPKVAKGHPPSRFSRIVTNDNLTLTGGFTPPRVSETRPQGWPWPRLSTPKGGVR